MTSFNNNINLLTAGRINASVNKNLAGSLTKLSTGQRINRAADNPAGLISSEQLRAALAALDAESRSLQRTDAVAAVAGGALGEVSDQLIEARTLATTNANTAGLSDAERQANQLQIDSILSNVDRVSRSTSFNGQPLLDGTASLTAAGATLDIGSVQSSDLGGVEIDGQSLTLGDVRTGGALDTASGQAAGAATAIDAAIGQVSRLRGEIGSFQKTHG